MYFEVKPSVSNNKLYMVVPTLKLTDLLLEKMGTMTTTWALVQARLFGLNYYDYLRMVEDKYNALILPNTQRAKYFSALFNNENDAGALCKELERRFVFVLKNR